jgi:hypothetical protein
MGFSRYGNDCPHLTNTHTSAHFRRISVISKGIGFSRWVFPFVPTEKWGLTEKTERKTQCLVDQSRPQWSGLAGTAAVSHEIYSLARFAAMLSLSPCPAQGEPDPLTHVQKSVDSPPRFTGRIWQFWVSGTAIGTATHCRQLPESAVTNREESAWRGGRAADCTGLENLRPPPRNHPPFARKFPRCARTVEAITLGSAIRSCSL